MVLPILRTGLHEGSQRPSHRFESPHLLVDVGDLRLGRCANLLAGHRRRIAQAKEVLNLGEGEAELLRSLDEADAADGSEGIGAVPRRLPRRFLEEAPPLIEPERLDVHPRLDRHLTDACSLFHRSGPPSCGTDAPYTLVQGQVVFPRIGFPAAGDTKSPRTDAPESFPQFQNHRSVEPTSDVLRLAGMMAALG